MKYLTRALLLAIVAALIAACGGAPAASPNSAPAASEPTMPPEPTATPVPPTPTPVLNVDEALRGALATTSEADAYRIEMTFSASGSLGEGLPQSDSGEPVEMISLSGEVAGENSRIVMKGLLAGMLGGDPATGVEFITVDGTTYVRGPVPLLNATEEKWYELPEGQDSPTSSFTADTLLESMQGDDVDFSGFSASGSEQIDGQECTLYTGDKETLAAVGDVGSMAGTDLEAMDKVEVSMAVCPDNRLHRMTIFMEGVPEGETEKTSIDVVVRMYDFDAGVSVTAPADAVPLPSMSQ